MILNITKKQTSPCNTYVLSINTTYYKHCDHTVTKYFNSDSDDLKQIITFLKSIDEIEVIEMEERYKELNIPIWWPQDGHSNEPHALEQWGLFTIILKESVILLRLSKNNSLNSSPAQL